MLLLSCTPASGPWGICTAIDTVASTATKRHAACLIHGHAKDAACKMQHAISNMQPATCNMLCVQRINGNCQAAFMTTPTAQAPQGFCQTTCGRCFTAAAPGPGPSPALTAVPQPPPAPVVLAPPPPTPATPLTSPSPATTSPTATPSPSAQPSPSPSPRAAGSPAPAPLPSSSPSSTPSVPAASPVGPPVSSPQTVRAPPPPPPPSPNLQVSKCNAFRPLFPSLEHCVVARMTVRTTSSACKRMRVHGILGYQSIVCTLASKRICLRLLFSMQCGRHFECRQAQAPVIALCKAAFNLSAYRWFVNEQQAATHQHACSLAMPSCLLLMLMVS